MKLHSSTISEGTKVLMTRIRDLEEGLCHEMPYVKCYGTGRITGTGGNCMMSLLLNPRWLYD